MWQPIDVKSWVSQRRSSLSDVKDSVEAIIDNVRQNGDKALFELTEKFDKQKLSSLKITRGQIDAAYDEVDDDLIQALIDAEARISEFHELQKPKSLWLEEISDGITLGVKTTPLERIGAYIPGGRAAYPSTVLMTVISARIAGVKEIVVCTPPPVNPLTLVAIDIAGATEAYSVGGAQAIAAMALGTETIKPVSKIVGPGNVFVTLAKMMLRDYAEIDFPAGPSEIGVVADESANPAYAAADILAQAEHDPNSACILITHSRKFAEAVEAEIEKQIKTSPRKEIIEKSLLHSGYVVTKSIDESIDMMNEVAPEHLSIQVSDPLSVL
ncbi:MAG TPA: histidinol dehydrogenase, partial [Methanocorpusculum sp.]|nr:histidinol dehydrogenase [Methanocorpusculum sp.]